jgi:hypothetical protein
MKVQTLARSIAMLLVGMLASWSAWALVVDSCVERSGLCVTIHTVDANNQPVSVSLIPDSGATVNLDSDTGGPNGGPGGAVNYGIFSIARCAGCAGRARIFVSEGSIDKLVFTDATVTNNTTGVTLPAKALTVTVNSGLLSVSGPAGDYPYATELTGTFSAPLLTGSTLDGIDQLTVTATTNGNCGEGPCMIDSPALDAGETNPFQYSLVAPPFLSSGVASYAPKEQQNISCGFSNFDGGSTPCQPNLGLGVNFTLKSRHSAKIQGSIGAFHVTSVCEPDSGDPARIKGCQIMADFFASLGPKGFKVYDVRLEPSPGTRLVDFRLDASNSSDVWVSRRGGDDDHDSDDGNISKTRARLLSNGSGEVQASGLCPASGCPTSNVLPVRVYCGGDNVATTALQLDKHGDGKATVSFGLPCVDPAVLIMDPNNNSSWVAAPAIL